MTWVGLTSLWREIPQSQFPRSRLRQFLSRSDPPPRQTGSVCIEKIWKQIGIRQIKSRLKKIIKGQKGSPTQDPWWECPAPECLSFPPSPRQTCQKSSCSPQPWEGGRCQERTDERTWKCFHYDMQAQNMVLQWTSVQCTQWKELKLCPGWKITKRKWPSPSQSHHLMRVRSRCRASEVRLVDWSEVQLHQHQLIWQTFIAFLLIAQTTHHPPLWTLNTKACKENISYWLVINRSYIISSCFIDDSQ